MESAAFLWKGPQKDGPTLAEFQALLAKYPTAQGLGTFLDGSLNGDVIENITADRLVATCRDLKDIGFMMHFSNFPAGFKAEDKQPLCVLKDNDQHIVLAFIQGQFPAFIKDDGHSPAYHFALEYLQPMLAEIWQDCDKDLAKLKKKLDGPSTRRGLQAAMVSHSTIALMLAHSDDPIVYSKDSAPLKTAFGWITDDIKVDATKSEPVKNKAGFARATGPKAVEPPPPPPPEEEVPEEEVPEEEAPVVETRPQVVNGGDTAVPATRAHLPEYCEIRLHEGRQQVFFVPPPLVNGNQLKSLYHRIAGFLPSKDDYGHWKHKKPAVPVRPEKLKGFDALALMQLEPKMANKMQRAQEQDQPPKTPEPAKIAPEEKPIDYTLQESAIKRIDSHLKAPAIVGIMDEFNNHMMSPEALATMEKKLPGFADNFKMSLLDTARWTIPFMESTIKDLHTMAVFAASWRLQALKWAPPEIFKTLNANVPQAHKKDDPIQRRSAGFAKAG